MRLTTLITVLAACSATPVDAALCPAGTTPRTQVDLYFGRNIGEVIGVSQEAWAKFLDEEITQNIPDGLSVLDIAGQWKDPVSGRIVREPGKRLTIIVEMNSALRSRLAAIISAYKFRHNQQSVLMTEQPVCATD